MYPGIWQILLVVVLLVLLFGRGKISELMGDVAKGIKSFKKGMSDDDDKAPETSKATKTIEHGADKEVESPKPVVHEKSKAS